jgi:hypothetical protein
VCNPPDENPIQLAVVTEVNGAGIMLSGCDLLATLAYLLINQRIHMKCNAISVNRGPTGGGLRREACADKEPWLCALLQLSRDGTRRGFIVEGVV